MFNTTAKAIFALADALEKHVALRKEELTWLRSYAVTKQDLKQLEKNMAIKVSEIKTAVAEFKKQNREALAEIGTKIADLNKQIADLIAGVGDPEVTDEAFEQDLKDLATDAKALADIVPGTPTPEA